MENFIFCAVRFFQLHLGKASCLNYQINKLKISFDVTKKRFYSYSDLTYSFPCPHCFELVDTVPEGGCSQTGLDSHRNISGCY